MLDALLNAVQALGNVVDTPGSVARGLGSAGVRGVRSLLGDDEQGRLAIRDLGRAVLGILDPSQRIYGSEWTGDPITGMVADIATDPLNLVGGVGLLKTAGKINKTLDANDAARVALATAHRDAKAYPGMLKGYMSPSYVAAAEAGAKLPTRHPMLKMPLSEAAKKAKAMSKDDFVFGPTKVAGDEIPQATYYRADMADDSFELNPTTSDVTNYVPDEMPEKLQESWNVFASRYPRTAAKYGNIAEEIASKHQGGFVHPGHSLLAAEGLPYLPQGMVTLKPNSGPATIFHEMLHAGQHRLGKFKDFATRADEHMALEPSAWRRNIETDMAKALYKYGNAVQDVPSQSPLLAALAGLNIGRAGREVGY